MPRTARHFALPVLAALLLAFAPVSRVAADPSGAMVTDPAVGSAPSLDPTTESADGTERSAGPGVTPLFVPMPFKNTQIGWGLMVMAGAIHRFDADTTIKPSTGAVGGFYTENGSWGMMAMEMARLAKDTWRLRGMLSHVDVKYDFYGIGEEAGEAGRSIEVEQTMNFGLGVAMRRVTPGLYAGASVLWMETSVAPQGTPGTGLPPVPQDLPSTELFAPGLQAEFDTRDDDYWPTVGSIAKLKTYFFTSALGGSREFQRYTASWSWYSELPKLGSVLATNVNAAATAGDAPYYALPSIGAGKYGLRGYTQGRYRDRVMTTVQAELRRPLAGRFGAVAFGGFGQVAPSAGELSEARVLPAGGAGVRYQLTRNYRMNMRLDFAWGRDEPLFYFSVSEAF